MAVGLLGPLNKIAYDTADEILKSGIIGKFAGIVSTFLTAGVEVVKTLTEDEPEEGDV